MSKIQGLTDLENIVTVKDVPCTICRLCGKRIENPRDARIHIGSPESRVLVVHRECGKALIEANSWEDDD